MAKRATAKPASKPLPKPATGTADVQTPAEALGESPQVNPLPPEADILADEPGLLSDAEPAAAPAPLRLHEPVEYARSYQTRPGAPDNTPPVFVLPAPPDLRSRPRR